MDYLTATKENTITNLEAKDNKLRTMSPRSKVMSQSWEVSGMNLMKINSAIVGHLDECAYQTNIETKFINEVNHGVNTWQSSQRTNLICRGVLTTGGLKST